MTSVVTSRTGARLTSRGVLRAWIVGRTVSDHDLRANSFDAVRLALALLVIISHAYPLGGRYGIEPLNLFSLSHFTLGDFAVAGFFAISGYLIVRSYEQLRSLPRYFWHRCLRILPGFWVCLIVTACVVAPVVAHLSGMSQHLFWSSPQGPVAYLQANWWLNIQQWGIAGLPRNIPWPGAFDGSLWTLWVEFRCYIAVAVIGAFGILTYARWFVPVFTTLLFAALVTTIVDPLLLQAQPLATYYGQWMDAQQMTLLYWVCFFLGGTAYLYRRFLPLSPLFAVVAVIVFLVSCRTSLTPIVAACCLPYVTLTAGFRLFVKQTAGLRRIGDLSYGTYIYGFIVEQVLSVLGVNKLLWVPWYALVAAIITLAISYFSWHLVEAPAMRLKSLGIAHAPKSADGHPSIADAADLSGGIIPARSAVNSTSGELAATLPRMRVVSPSANHSIVVRSAPGHTPSHDRNAQP